MMQDILGEVSSLVSQPSVSEADYWSFQNKLVEAKDKSYQSQPIEVSPQSYQNRPPEVNIRSYQNPPVKASNGSYQPNAFNKNHSPTGRHNTPSHSRDDKPSTPPVTPPMTASIPKTVPSKEPVTLVTVLRLLMAIEEKLGSFSAKVTCLLFSKL